MFYCLLHQNFRIKSWNQHTGINQKFIPHKPGFSGQILYRNPFCPVPDHLFISFLYIRIYFISSMKKIIAFIVISLLLCGCASDKKSSLGAQISRDYEGKDLLLVSILKGSVVFMADLMRAITEPCSIDFMVVSSYGGANTTSTGLVKIVKDLDQDLSGKDVLIVEDILDTGVTLSHLVPMLKLRRPNSVRLCTILSKPSRRKVDIEPDYCGFEVPDEFVVGYGLDYDEKYRNLPYVGVLKPEVYSK